MPCTALRAQRFTLSELVEALKADPEAATGFCRIAPEQMRAIACAVWARAADLGFDASLPGTDGLVTLRSLAWAIHTISDLAFTDPSPPPGATDRYVFFGAGEAQLAFVIEAVRVEGLREHNERARLNGGFGPIGVDIFDLDRVGLR